MAATNPLWGAPRIHGELLKLWIDVAERVIGSIRRECLDHVIVINERHLRRRLRSYLAYYDATRPHQALRGNSPHPGEVQPPACGRIIAIPQVGGLHYRYQRVA